MRTRQENSAWVRAPTKSAASIRSSGEATSSRLAATMSARPGEYFTAPRAKYFGLKLRHARLGPFSVLLDQRNQARVGLGRGDIVLHARLADVEVDFSRRAADVAEIRVGHFPG